MLARHITAKLKGLAGQYPVVTLTGPRQSGKTTLVKSVFSDYEYVSLEDRNEREFAMEDPRGFLGRFRRNVILDEVQRAPDLFSSIQVAADETGRAGQFILTGSQNFLLMERISQSLAGRCAILYLLPLSRGEIRELPPVEADRLGEAHRREGKEREDLYETLYRGGYPRIYDQGLDAQEWLANYTSTYLERDVRNVVQVGNLELFGRFLSLCAGRCGQILNLSSLASDCGVSSDTAKRWLSILEASFVLYLLRPHYRNFSKRLIKSPKVYFLDTGLLCYLLRIRRAEELSIHAMRGSIFESWVLSEAVKCYCNEGRKADVYYWRDSQGHEIDLILDRGQELVPVEIKSGQTVSGESFAPLKQWQELSGQKEGRSAIVYGGEESYARQGVSVVAWRDWC